MATDPKAVRQQLENIFQHVYLKDYQPPLGWDPGTGEPWMAVRCYANLAYASLVGTQGHNLHALRSMMNFCNIEFARVDSLAIRFPYVLLWIEFLDTRAPPDPTTVQEFLSIRKFLCEWSSNPLDFALDGIHLAYEEFLQRPILDRSGHEIPLPNGFSFTQNPQMENLSFAEPVALNGYRGHGEDVAAITQRAVEYYETQNKFSPYFIEDSYGHPEAYSDEARTSFKQEEETDQIGVRQRYREPRNGHPISSRRRSASPQMGKVRQNGRFDTRRTSNFNAQSSTEYCRPTSDQPIYERSPSLPSVDFFFGGTDDTQEHRSGGTGDSKKVS